MNGSSRATLLRSASRADARATGEQRKRARRARTLLTRITRTCPTLGSAQALLAWLGRQAG